MRHPARAAGSLGAAGFFSPSKGFRCKGPPPQRSGDGCSEGLTAGRGRRVRAIRPCQPPAPPAGTSPGWWRGCTVRGWGLWGATVPLGMGVSLQDACWCRRREVGVFSRPVSPPLPAPSSPQPRRPGASSTDPPGRLSPVAPPPSPG